MAYDVSDHPLRSAASSKLEEPIFEEHQAWAEDLLGVAGTSYTGRSKSMIQRAITLQINWQLTLPKDIWFHKQVSSSQSKQNVTYRDGILWVDPRAEQLVSFVEAEEDVGSRYGDMRSIR